MRRTPLKRRTRLRQINRDRRARMYQRNYAGTIPGHNKADWIRNRRCCTCGKADNIHAHHVRSRGAGGDARDLVPLCAGCHRYVHDVGLPTFEGDNCVNLSAKAREIEEAWRVRCEDLDPTAPLVDCGECNGTGQHGLSLDPCLSCGGAGVHGHSDDADPGEFLDCGEE